MGKHISRRKEEKSEWEKFNKNENTNAWPKPALEKTKAEEEALAGSARSSKVNGRESGDNREELGRAHWTFGWKEERIKNMFYSQHIYIILRWLHFKPFSRRMASILTPDWWYFIFPNCWQTSAPSAPTGFPFPILSSFAFHIQSAFFRVSCALGSSAAKK